MRYSIFINGVPTQKGVGGKLGGKLQLIPKSISEPLPHVQSSVLHIVCTYLQYSVHVYGMDKVERNSDGPERVRTCSKQRQIQARLRNT